MPYRDRDRKRAWDREYRRRVRLAAADRVRHIRGVVPWQHPYTVPQALARRLRAMGIEPESLTWEALRALALGLEPQAAASLRLRARDEALGWYKARFKALEQENARLQDALAQLDRHASASHRIIREQAAGYDATATESVHPAGGAVADSRHQAQP